MKLPSRLISGSVRPDRASLARFASLRWAALPIIDRRWTAPMSAIALGFGLFVGVAIGPGTEGTLGSNPMVIEVPPPEAPQTALAPSTPDEDDNGNGDSGGNGGDQGGGTPPSPTLDDLGGVPDSSPPVFDTPSIPPPPVITTPPAPPIDTTSDDTTEDSDTTEEEQTTELAGTVVHLNPAAASYTIATDDGLLQAIHTHEPPGIGREVKVDALTLANGTYVEDGKRRQTKLRGQAEFNGTVSFRDPVTGAYTVSAPGVSMLVRGGAQRTPPDIGERAEVEARIADNPVALPVSEPGEQGCGEAPKPPKPPKPPATALEQTGLTIADGDPSALTDIEAVVQGVCRDTRKLVVSADDVRESGRDIALAVPKKFKLASLEPGQVLSLGATIGDGGALVLSTVAGDEGKRGAEDERLVQPRVDTGGG